MAQFIQPNGAAPSTPSAGNSSLYFSSADNLPHFVDDAGVDYQILNSLYPTVGSATTIDIFGAKGVTISLTGTATITGITTCTTSKVGSTKRIICTSTPTITASANLTVDGATTGSVPYPANAILEILATSTTTFAIRTIYATGTFTGTGTGFTVAPTMTLSYIRQDNVITLRGTTGILTGTSNATTKTVTGSPTIIIPANSQYILMFSQDNGGAWQACNAIIGNGGVITFYKDVGSSAFTASGTASLAIPTITYVLN